MPKQNFALFIGYFCSGNFGLPFNGGGVGPTKVGGSDQSGLVSPPPPLKQVLTASAVTSVSVAAPVQSRVVLMSGLSGSAPQP